MIDQIEKFNELSADNHARIVVSDSGVIVLLKNEYCPDKGCFLREVVFAQTTAEELQNELDILQGKLDTLLNFIEENVNQLVAS